MSAVDFETVRATIHHNISLDADAYEDTHAALARIEQRLRELEREVEEWKVEADRGKWPKEKAQEFFQLQARVRELEAQTRESRTGELHAGDAAEAAEARVRELEEALRETGVALRVLDRTSSLDPALKREAGQKRKRALDALAALDVKLSE